MDPERIGDTILLCRPGQYREAAVLLSCLPADCFTPLIVLEPPPVAEAEYRRLHEAYRAIRFRRDDAIGGPLGRRQVIAGRAPVVSNEAVDSKAEPLTPFRSWWRHHQQMAALLAANPHRRAIFLCAPPAEEIAPIDPVPLDKILDDRFPLLPETIERIHLLPKDAAAPGDAETYGSLAELARIGWRLCRPGIAFPEDALRIADDDPLQVFAGLSDALATGLPLVLGAESARAPVPVASAPTTASEAVLIEVAADAQRLLGVQYARARGAKLVLYPEPETVEIEAARQAMEHWADDAVKGSGSIRAFLAEARAFFVPSAAPAPASLERLEAAVSAVVPEAVVREVGALPLTAFTRGVPYGFVRAGGADWSQKPIGHITGDAALLVLGEMLRWRSGSGIEFNLVFDPGFFETEETTDVLAVLRHRVSHTMVLREHEASMVALLHLSNTLPLEIVYFNTHGSDKAIKLMEGWWPTYKIVQRVALGSHPIVFNNSCLSWVGVGRDFVRTGARSYIGTLWPVDAAEAARFARSVLHEMVQKDAPIARAILAPGIDPLSQRAYILVGTCSAGLERAAAAAEDRSRVATAIQNLLHSAIGFSRQGDAVDLLFARTLCHHLCDDSAAMLAKYARQWPEPSLDLFEMLVLRIALLAEVARERPGVAEEGPDVVDRAGKVLDALSGDAATIARHRAHWLQMSARLSRRLGRTEEALLRLGRSIEAARRAGIGAGPQYLELSDTLKSLGRLPEALKAAQDAEKAYAAEAGDARKGRMLALGRLASIANALRRPADALDHAERGFSLAQELGDLDEQAEFKADEARALLRLRKFDDAYARAAEAEKLARRAHRATKEVSAHGVMVQALIGKQELEQALREAKDGLALAQVQNLLSEQGDYCIDIATIHGLRNMPVDAFNAALPSVLYFAESGDVAKLRNALGFLTNLHQQIYSWDTGRLLTALAVAVAVAGDDDLRQRIAITSVSMLKSMISRYGWMASRPELVHVATDLSAVEAHQGALPREAAFVVRIVKMLSAWAEGAQSQARAEAAALDAETHGGFALGAFLAQAPAPAADKSR